MLFSEEAIGFLFENHTRDSKEWFKEHKADYHRLIEEPFAELITALTPIMNDIDSRIVCNPKKISRLYKDARYNKSGPIFRESVWCSLKCQRDKSEYHPMPEFYFYISTHGFGYGCGYYKTDRESMDEMRAMILAGAQEYKKAYKALKDNSKFVLFGDEYKRDHFPNASREDALWLNKKDIGVSFDSEDPKLLFNVNLLDTVCSDLASLGDVYRFFMRAEDNILQKKVK